MNNYTGQFPKAEFAEIKRLNPFWSSYICFAETIKGRKLLHPRLIKKYFDKLVDRGDYSKTDKNEIVRYLLGLASGKEG